MKTYIASEKEIQASKRWYVVDAEGQVLGRLASKIAHILRGKNKPIYSPHQDAGDFVIVVNAEKINLTGKKMQQKTYFRHSGYPGGVTETSVDLMLKTHPERVIESAVKRMLPKNSLGRSMGTKLKIYAGPNHPHKAQSPQKLELN
ncbi:MAG: 50S ribosomal protein L13 [Calditrichaceae bacterium]